MSFRMHNRKLLFKLESTEGTAASPAEVDYIECIEPTFTVTGRTFERNPTRKSITPAPLHTVGGGKAAGNPSATVEFSFQLELAGTGTAAPTSSTVPRWTRVLKACGLAEVFLSKAVITDSIASAGGSPDVFRHYDMIQSDDNALFTSPTTVGRVISDHYGSE